MSDVERLQTSRTAFADELRDMADRLESGEYESVCMVAVEADGGGIESLREIREGADVYALLGYLQALLTELTLRYHGM